MSKDMRDCLDGWIASWFYFFSLHPILHTHVSVSASVSQESKQQILQPLSVLRPKFRVNEHFNNIATSNIRIHL